MISITPYISDKLPGSCQDQVVELLKLDAALNANIPVPLRGPLEELLRAVNSFYSNKIEGNPTLPKEILRTQLESNAVGAKSKGLAEILSHIETEMKYQLKDLAKEEVFSILFIQGLHKEYYKGLSLDDRRIMDKDGNPVSNSKGDPVYVIPGKIRDGEVIVGAHVPPHPDDLGTALKWYESVYDPKKIFGTSKIIAAICAHHRFAWIHPFMDGNGRVGRLLTDCHLKAAGLGGYGLWTMSRGFGRQTKSYYAALADADQPRKGDLDGRGELSDSGLVSFIEYFLEVALDQVNYFSDLLNPGNLRTRIDLYFEYRSRNSIQGIDKDLMPLLRIEARDIYRVLLERGAMSRADIYRYLGKGETTIRPILVQMEKERLIYAPKRKDISIRLSPASLEMLFPQLW